MTPPEMLMKAARYLVQDGASLDEDEAIEIGLFLANMAGQWEYQEAKEEQLA